MNHKATPELLALKKKLITALESSSATHLCLSYHMGGDDGLEHDEFLLLVPEANRAAALVAIEPCQTDFVEQTIEATCPGASGGTGSKESGSVTLTKVKGEWRHVLEYEIQEPQCYTETFDD